MQPKHAEKLKFQLLAIHTAFDIGELNLPAYNLHPLKGDRSGSWFITVNGNWRLTFRFENGDAYIKDYEDYH